VNVASRIESLTKQHHVDILVSDHTWRRLSPRFEGEPLGEEHVKGRTEPVRVHAVKALAAGPKSALG
jgi:adenylate cyclase